MSRKGYVGAGLVGALVAGVFVLAVALGSEKDVPAGAAVASVETNKPATWAVAGDETAALLDGIPQDGEVLGAADAPVVLVEFADFQCPACATVTRQVLPTVIREYVRPGDVKLVFSGMAFIGPDSVEALRAALAAGEQDKLWHVVDLLFQQQGGENEGWVTDDLLGAIGAAVAGLDVGEMMEDSASEPVTEAMAAAAQNAVAAGVQGTPSFYVGKEGGQLRPVYLTRPEADELRWALDAALEH